MDLKYLLAAAAAALMISGTASADLGDRVENRIDRRRGS